MLRNTKNNSKKLGKGIASLLSELPTMASVNSSFDNPLTINETRAEARGPLLINIEDITVNPNQPRKYFNDNTLQELANSIKENGIIQPLVVEKLNDTYYLISGERRLRASKIAGLESVPVIFKRVTAREKAIMALVENIQREDLNCVDEAMSYFSLIDDYKLTQEDLAKKIGKSRSSIANFLRILKLPKEVLSHLRSNTISFGHGKVLSKIAENKNRCIALINLCIENRYSVRELEKLMNKPISKVRENKAQLKNENNISHLVSEMETKTGFHCDLKMNNSGSGKLVLKFTSKSEFESIYNFILK